MEECVCNGISASHCVDREGNMNGPHCTEADASGFDPDGWLYRCSRHTSGGCEDVLCNLSSASTRRGVDYEVDNRYEWCVAAKCRKCNSSWFLCMDCRGSRQMTTTQQLKAHEAFHKKKGRKTTGTLVCCRRNSQVWIATQMYPSKKTNDDSSDSSSGTNNSINVHIDHDEDNESPPNIPYGLESPNPKRQRRDGTQSPTQTFPRGTWLTPGTPSRQSTSPLTKETLMERDGDTFIPRTPGAPNSPSTAVVIGSRIRADQATLLVNNSIPHALPATMPQPSIVNRMGIPAFATRYVLWEQTNTGWGIHDCVARSLEMTDNMAHTMTHSEVLIQLQIGALCHTLTVGQQAQLAGIFDHLATPSVTDEPTVKKVDAATHSQAVAVSPTVAYPLNRPSTTTPTIQVPATTECVEWLSTRSTTQGSHSVRSSTESGYDEPGSTRRYH